MASNKLYIFGIGGTGSRVLKSLTMLLSAGVECGADTIVPIIIDRDKGNGDYSRTDGLLKNYITVNKIVPKNDDKKNIKNRFFNTEIKLLGNELLLKLDDETKKFAQFIGFDDQKNENKALSQMLFSENTLNMDTEYGFKGNPNIGSVVLNQFDDKNIFKAFASDFQDGDKIFIISSIFGGTGASGFPLLRKILQTENLKDATGTELPHWGLINEAPIGAISVLPYFNVDKKDNVDSDTFNDKTRAALSYYENENGKLDTLYYIADTNRKKYKYAEGGKEQQNDAHFVELSAAMSILDFVNADKTTMNFQKDGNGNRKTIYKEFGINSDVTEIGFDNLSAETQKLLVNPLSRFMLFAKYMGYTIVKKTEDGIDKYVAERITQYDIFSKENKYQPYAHNRFTGSFRNNIVDLETIQCLFLDWLQEMTQQSRKFIPFNLTTSHAFDFVNGNINLFVKPDFRYNDWALVDNELNRQISKTNTSLKNDTGEKFIELFYRATEALINQTTQNNGDGTEKYIFRLQNEGDYGLLNTIEHWAVSDMYGEKQRNAIKSSNVNSDNQPTSIPSPFARIALVKTAFAEVAAYGEKALKAYQKIVSDTLDIAEIFFTLDKWKSKGIVDVISWDRTKNLPELSNVKTQKILYKTLEAFLDSDAETYNFDKMKCIYILKHKATGEMIGATSPSTLFFSSANDMSKIDIQLSTHKAFKRIVPLCLRNWDFQKYLYTWFAVNNEIRNATSKNIFAELQSYLNAQKQVSINNGKSATDFDITDFVRDENGKVKNYKQLRSPDVEILGKYYYGLDLADKTKENKDKIKKILEVDDLLEDNIIRLPYAIRKDSFFDGNLPNDCKYTYLLPVKEAFFEHYKIADLKKSIKIGHFTNSAVVTLEIDGKKYERTYTDSGDKGYKIIQPSEFDCAVFPNVRFAEDKDAHYRFGLVCDFREKEKYSAEFVKIDSAIDTTKKRESVCNETFSNNKQLKNYSLEGSNFDYVRINYDGISGIVVPNLELKNGSKEFVFTVDFGTTNTHIEYKDGSDKEKKFDISENSKDKKNERQIHWLHGGEDTLKYVFDEEFIPAYTDSEFKFPMRSALSFGEKTNWSNVYPFEKASPAVLYEKRFESPYNEITTDLKWSDNADNKNQVKAYIESLMFLLRNKVIIGNGDLSKTKIRWFYPVAMERGRYNNFENAWNDAYKKYFGDDKKNIVPITESVAPFEYYVRDGNSSNLVTIDIGGGTTDIVIASGSKNADCITSFRFAANSIFGDGYSETGRVKNGIVRQFANAIKEELQTEISENDDLFRIFQDMVDNKNSSDIASFLFSIGNNKKVVDAGKNLSQNANLSKKLKEEPKSQEITFIFFYSAIIYHLAKLMKAKDFEMPDKIVFSGNGSRVISLFTNDRKLLADYTKLIFTKVNNINQYHENGLEIILNEHEPKEATCKGGFYVTKPESYGDIFKKKIVLHSNGTNTVIQHDATDLSNSPKEADKNKSINSDYINKTVEEAKVFINFVFELLPFFSNNGYKLNADSVNVAKETCSKKLDIYAKNGWELKKKEVSDDEVIEETLFFYPLVGMLKELSDAICNKNLSNTK